MKLVWVHRYFNVSMILVVYALKKKSYTLDVFNFDEDVFQFKKYFLTKLVGTNEG